MRRTGKMPRAGLRAASPFPLISAAIAAASLSASCGAPDLYVGYETDPALLPRLEGIVAESPLPSRLRRASSAEGAALRLRLLSLEPRDEAPKNSFPCGLEYYAAAVDLADPRYSVDAREAADLGLEPLESIEPPKRALAVEESWPPSASYPFAKRLFLEVSSPSRASVPPAALEWAEAASRHADKLPGGVGRPPFRLAAVGDLQVGEAQGEAMLGGEAGMRRLIDGELLAGLRSADVAVCNLESPISSRGEANPRKRFHFRMPPGASSALKGAGFDLALLGNNHVFDYGPQAFADTLEDLSAASLPEVGAGRDSAEAAEPRFIDLPGGERLAFVGFAFFPREASGFTREEAAAGPGKPGISIDEEKTLGAIREAAASGATVVVLAHGGVEYSTRPSDQARRLYSRFAEAGAALVLGSHPHVLQGCEARSGAVIAYSLGNFLFTLEEEPPEAWRGAELDFLVYRGKIRGILPRPIVAGYYGTVPDPDLDGARRRFSRLSAGISALPPLATP